ncbi:hypothetical protein GC088_14760 [Arthrobacter sp. JZ12]|uniref:lantibiotic dehydratase C-terminal domain-containing protein n=1 Tax=Arthrobacter sp. JZ12 TaxID=2654190 RepID=UPI002B464217|nr:lantibiotic dehydratase C-terminal domain-containing protein [Arthrobacter sp. JZ12]WRH26204.1 hypothetical protein GC088_14760 [Arthrobacter sp. JZ12]
MSQLAAVRTASRTASGTQWWHLSTQAGGFDVADGIIGDLVTPLVAQARVLRADRWFYTRSVEPTAVQVRLHILAEPATIDRLQAVHRVLLKRNECSLASLQSRQSVSTPATNGYYLRGVEEADPQLEAELFKYGGVEGLQLAEEVFELSSELAAWGTQRFAKMHNRSAFASLLLFDSARSMVKGPRSASWPDRRRISWDYYWDSHLKTCTPDLGTRGQAVREAMANQVSAKAPAFQGLMAATAAESAVHNWRRRWFRAIDTYLYRADKARVSRSAQHLTVHQAHMTLNRLGFTSREEAVLGLYARTWSAERERELFNRN